MMFVSTRHADVRAHFEKALISGLAPDGGLYIPEYIPRLSADHFRAAEQASLVDLGIILLGDFLPEIPRDDFARIMRNTLNFPIPLVHLFENIFLLEVFHGPTLAFKDVGARFMANMLSYFLAHRGMKIKILVATSGDTGSAIAHGFYRIPHVDVYILYPSGRISQLQEKQMTTLGDNIHAIEVKGTFDDCQRLVKTALLDADIRAKNEVTTANSINIARLLPQIIYHGFGLTQLMREGIQASPLLSVPSGNFGNLTAAIYAQHMGLPVKHFIAATNINAVVPHYLETGQYAPHESKRTFSNAMDVGHPSNFERLQSIYEGQVSTMRHAITGVSVSDDHTLDVIRETYAKTKYILDPHTAVGVAAAETFLRDKRATPVIVTATAHPAKFPDVIKQALGFDIELPESLQKALAAKKISTVIEPDYEVLKALLI